MFVECKNIEYFKIQQEKNRQSFIFVAKTKKERRKSILNCRKYVLF
jgi:hypothetical protein